MLSWLRRDRALKECPEHSYEADSALAGSGLSYLLCLPSCVISEYGLCSIPGRKAIKCYSFLCTKFYIHVLMALFTFFSLAVMYFLVWNISLHSEMQMAYIWLICSLGERALGFELGEENSSSSSTIHYLSSPGQVLYALGPQIP